MQLITHRGIDVRLGDSQAWAMQESRWESFSAQIRAGWGLEFDVRPLNDGQLAISHDSSLGRIAPGHEQLISTLTRSEFEAIQVPGGRLCMLDELLRLIAEGGQGISALHLKSHCHEPAILAKILETLETKFESLIGRLLLFDATPPVAEKIVKKLPGLDIAASVAHTYDIFRYGALTGETLLTSEQVIANQHLYSWVWLDEWDTVDIDSGEKIFVNHKSVELFRNAGFKVAVVSPELHASSPALLGGEAHKDGSDDKRLVERWAQLGQLRVDALCTDHASWIAENRRVLKIAC
jgi:glycerophosphoryl diester phosphodiesterase